ncbi:unnamed protein product, partial [Allacma fusca]
MRSGSGTPLRPSVEATDSSSREHVAQSSKTAYVSNSLAGPYNFTGITFIITVGFSDNLVTMTFSGSAPEVPTSVML